MEAQNPLYRRALRLGVLQAGAAQHHSIKTNKIARASYLELETGPLDAVLEGFAGVSDQHIKHLL